MTLIPHIFHASTKNSISFCVRNNQTILLFFHHILIGSYSSSSTILYEYKPESEYFRKSREIKIYLIKIYLIIICQCFLLIVIKRHPPPINLKGPYRCQFIISMIKYFFFPLRTRSSLPPAKSAVRIFSSTDFTCRSLM